MGRHDRRRRPRLVELLALASTASAMSLSNFQVITSSSIPLACILAYNQPITGCTSVDFIQGRSCSATCIRDILTTQTALRTVCAGVNAPDTVLGQAIAGNLVNILCPSGNQNVATEANLVPPTTQQAPTPTASIPGFSSIPTDVPPPPPVASDPPPPPPPQEATQIAGAPAPSGPLGVNPTQATGAQETNIPQGTADNSPGGGSPFDVSAAVASDSIRLVVPRVPSLLAAGILAYLLR